MAIGLKGLLEQRSAQIQNFVRSSWRGSGLLRMDLHHSLQPSMSNENGRWLCLCGRLAGPSGQREYRLHKTLDCLRYSAKPDGLDAEGLPFGADLSIRRVLVGDRSPLHALNGSYFNQLSGVASMPRLVPGHTPVQSILPRIEIIIGRGDVAQVLSGICGW